MDSTTSSAAQSAVSSMIGSTMSIVEYPVDDEAINDQSTDSDVGKRKETKLRLQSIYSRVVSEPSVVTYPSVDTSKFRHCIVCERPIMELVVWAMNKPHHCRCLVCFVCKQPVGFRKFKVVEGKMLMCYKDYYESYQRCRICQKPFEEKTTRSYKKLYHKDCFKCVNCFEPVTADGALELFDETYCTSCAESLVTKKNLLQSYYEAIGRKFEHPRDQDVENKNEIEGKTKSSTPT